MQPVPPATLPPGRALRTLTTQGTRFKNLSNESPAQRWFYQRLDGLEPKDFLDKPFVFFTTQSLKAPAAFAGITFDIPEPVVDERFYDEPLDLKKDIQEGDVREETSEKETSEKEKPEKENTVKEVEQEISEQEKKEDEKIDKKKPEKKDESQKEKKDTDSPPQQGSLRQYWRCPLDDKLKASLEDTCFGVVFGDLSEADARKACAFNAALAEIHDSPPLVFVANTKVMAPIQDDAEEFKIMCRFQDMGFDRVLMGEPAGFELAAAVSSEFAAFENTNSYFMNKLNERRGGFPADYLGKLHTYIDDILWDYCVEKLNCYLPPPNQHEIKMEVGTQIGKYKISSKLVDGAAGPVFGLEPLLQGGAKQVLKCIDKKTKRNVWGLKNLQNEISIMRRLSSKQLQHPYIVRLHEVYNFKNCVIFRMEDSGESNLYRYLRNAELERLTVSPSSVITVMKQGIQALCHLHLNAQVVHRDIKSEHVCIKCAAADREITSIQVCDFNLARITLHQGMMRAQIGTFPFMAPEVISGQPYDPFPIDIWSFGVVLTEVVCTCDIFMRQLNLPRIAKGDDNRADTEKEQLDLIHNWIRQPSTVGKMLETHHRPGLKTLVQGNAAELVDGMLAVDVSRRISVEELHECVPSLGV